MTSPDDTGYRPDEPSWERLARMRREIKALGEQVAEDTPAAIEAARKAGISIRDLAASWGVTESWLYKIIKHQPATDNTTDDDGRS